MPFSGAMRETAKERVPWLMMVGPFQGEAVLERVSVPGPDLVRPPSGRGLRVGAGGGGMPTERLWAVGGRRGSVGAVSGGMPPEILWRLVWKGARRRKACGVSEAEVALKKGVVWGLAARVVPLKFRETGWLLVLRKGQGDIEPPLKLMVE